MNFRPLPGPFLEVEPERAKIVCDLGGWVEPDLGAIDALARLQLVARRHGFEVRLGSIPPRLRELLAFTGLAEALGLEPGGEPEQRKQSLSVEEEGELEHAPG